MGQLGRTKKGCRMEYMPSCGVELVHCKGRNNFIMSDFLELLQIGVIEAMMQQFATHGIPMVVHMDGGPQFVPEEFSGFSRFWTFKHTVSSAYSSQ